MARLEQIGSIRGDYNEMRGNMETSQYLDMFIDESKEHLDTLYQQLLELEKSPHETALIEEIFRAAHTLKGMAATMEFKDLAQVTHVLENVFEGIRENRLQVHAVMMDVLLDSVDYLNAMVEDIAAGGDGKCEVTPIVSALSRIEQGEESQKEPPLETIGMDRAEQQAGLSLDEFQLAILSESEEQGYQSFTIDIQLIEECLLKAARVFMIFEILDNSGEVVHTNPSIQALEEEQFENSFQVILVTTEEPKIIHHKLLKVSEVDTANVSPLAHQKQPVLKKNPAPLPSEKAAKSAESASSSRKVTASKTIRVNIDRLDELMNLFEELVIDRGQLEQISQQLRHNELQETVERMSRVSSDLQHIILTMRMVPIDTVFNRFPRMIRQLSRSLQKEVEVQIIGADTELDRTVIDEIGDPLVHLIRNSMDHGMETPEVRRKAHKPEKGTLILAAYHSGNHVFLEISDDGAGIQVDKVKKKAIEKGIVSEKTASEMSDQSAFNLIMSSGFSTNEAISDVSGRGVGLDVVKNTIESLGGSITIESEANKGSTFTVQLPLTLSIISVLLVELAHEKYAIPLSSIIETAILEKMYIHHVHKNKVINHRGQIIPLLDLRDVFSVSKKEQRADAYFSIVIVRKGNKLTGFIVDSFIGQQEVVLKSLGNYLTDVFAISGATILGDGEVALIVDSNALIQ